MTNIKPVSDLINYSEVLQEVSSGSPVILTENDQELYAVVSIEDYRDYEITLAEIRLMNELYKGQKSGEKDGWLTFEEFEESRKKFIDSLGITPDE